MVNNFNWFLYSIINRSQYQLFSIIPSFLYFIFHSLDRSLFCLREKVSTNQIAPSIQMMTHIKLFLWANYIIYTQLFYVLCWHTFSELIRSTPYLDFLVNTLALSYPRGPHCTVYILETVLLNADWLRNNTRIMSQVMHLRNFFKKSFYIRLGFDWTGTLWMIVCKKMTDVYGLWFLILF